MEREQKCMILRIGVTLALLIAAMLIPYTGAWRWTFFFLPFLIIGYDVVRKAGRHIGKGQVFDENLLMCLATAGAFAIGEYPEAVAVMLFYQVGELFTDIALDKSRDSIAKLMDIRPDAATVVRDGAELTVSPSDVALDEMIVVRPGERIPLDGVITEGSTSINTMPLTGESMLRDAGVGDAVISGCINLNGVIHVRVSHAYAESTVARILDLVENATENKARSERFITKFARIYTPVVVGLAVLLAVIPPLCGLGAWSEWLRRALLFLVVSCPCALVVSVPLSFFGGIGGASHKGILIKGAQYIETLAHTGVVVFDKTGTLTAGTFFVTAVHPNTVSEDALLQYAAYAEAYSDHPISQSLRDAYARPIDTTRIASASELAGRGIQAVIDGHTVLVGNPKWMDEHSIAWHTCHHTGTIVHVSVDGEYAGHIVISDKVKEHAALAIHALKEQGVRQTVMLTGDQKAVADEVGRSLGIDTVYAELLPQDKVAMVDTLSRACGQRETLIYVGDGINDAPVLARADVGIAMGAMGADAAIEAADVVLMDDDPLKIALTLQVAKRTRGIVIQNIVFALTVKAAVLVFGALGLATMWGAVFADVGVTLIAVINAMRALRMPSADSRKGRN